MASPTEIEWNLPSGLLSPWCSEETTAPRQHRSVQATPRPLPKRSEHDRTARNPRCTSLVARRFAAAGRNAEPILELIRVLRLQQLYQIWHPLNQPQAQGASTPSPARAIRELGQRLGSFRSSWRSAGRMTGFVSQFYRVSGDGILVRSAVSSIGRPCASVRRNSTGRYAAGGG